MAKIVTKVYECWNECDIYRPEKRGALLHSNSKRGGDGTWLRFLSFVEARKASGDPMLGDIPRSEWVTTIDEDFIERIPLASQSPAAIAWRS